jgi:hypothetical protein
MRELVGADGRITPEEEDLLEDAIRTSSNYEKIKMYVSAESQEVLSKQLDRLAPFVKNESFRGKTAILRTLCQALLVNQKYDSKELDKLGDIAASIGASSELRRASKIVFGMEFP